MSVDGNVHIFDHVDGLYAALKEQWRILSLAAIKDHGSFNVALAGGSTPRRLYEILASHLGIDEKCWNDTHIYFGDERCVPQDHPDSNYRMAQETLLTVASLPPENVHAMFSAELSVAENVSAYNALLHKKLPVNNDQCPVFDLVLLGMGEDGHTASLFPGTEILHESKHAVAAQFVKKLDAWRISLTFPVINAADHVAVLVVGENKSKIIADIFSGTDGAVLRYPIQQVDPIAKMEWYLDSKAATLLTAGN